MDKLNKFFKDFYKWDTTESLKAILGCFIFSFAINIFIVPNSLYNGGVLGFSQLIRSILKSLFNINFSFDIAGILTFIFNIPLFIMAYRLISKTFFRRTLVCMFFQTIFLTFIPIPEKSLVDDVLTSVLIGGIIAGFGSGLTLTSSGSGGGTDIIGLILTMRSKNFSVGKLNRIIDYAIYGICGLLYGIPTMIYSIIYAVISSLITDQTHKQNICSYVMVFTKQEPDKIIEFIREKLDRDATYWKAKGAYENTTTYILYSAMSKYEMQRFERHIHNIDENAFVITSEGVGIDGNFEKKLSS